MPGLPPIPNPKNTDELYDFCRRLTDLLEGHLNDQPAGHAIDLRKATNLAIVSRLLPTHCREVPIDQWKQGHYIMVAIARTWKLGVMEAWLPLIDLESLQTDKVGDIRFALPNEEPALDLATELPELLGDAGRELEVIEQDTDWSELAKAFKTALNSYFYHDGDDRLRRLYVIWSQFEPLFDELNE